ncbi:DUF2484 family protein [Pseudooceanicola sp. LIPI14-2-Ac024]|uniref:DUF2484 family protein n=1 Tax=Pseudooceanicola sp. LIPI14-2-Ac024 TaxID=3344875 RepID=UPI0035D0ECB2
MTWALILVCLWALAANLVAMLPSRDSHWTSAYALIATGVPILGYVTWTHGAIVGLLVLAAGCSILRWPVIYLWRWLRRKAGIGEAAE